MKNFRARKQKSGRTFYYFDTGQKPRKELPLGSDYVLAVRKWSELMAAPAQAPVTNFKQLADRYLLEVMPTKAKNTQRTQTRDIKQLVKYFCTPSPAPLDQIKPKHIHALLQWQKAHPTTANRLKRVFSHMFNMARAWGYTDAENPVKGIEGFELEKREVYVTDEAFRAIWTCATQPIRDIMDLAYLTGQRPGDMLEMTERDIVNGMLQVKQGKTKALRRIVIEGDLKDLLERIKERKARYKVWSAHLAVNLRGLPLTEATLRNGWMPARAKAAADAEEQGNAEFAAMIRSVRFYDLRAKAADDVSEDPSRGDQGAADLLGHANVNVTKKHYIRRGKIVRPTK